MNTKSSTAAERSGYRNVTPLEAANALARTRLIDVREPDEFHGPLGHIPGAELVPLATLESASRAWSREAPLMVVCRSGARSAKAAALLVQRGFLFVANLEGGTQGYVDAGLRVERR